MWDEFLVYASLFPFVVIDGGLGLRGKRLWGEPALEVISLLPSYYHSSLSSSHCGAKLRASYSCIFSSNNLIIIEHNAGYLSFWDSLFASNGSWICQHWSNGNSWNEILFTNYYWLLYELSMESWILLGRAFLGGQWSIILGYRRLSAKSCFHRDIVSVSRLQEFKCQMLTGAVLDLIYKRIHKMGTNIFLSFSEWILSPWRLVCFFIFTAFLHLLLLHFLVRI